MDDLQKFLAEVKRESRKAGKEADLEAYAHHFQMARCVMERRQALGWTQTHLSKASGVQQSEISRIERGQGNPTMETFHQLVSSLGMKLTIVPVARKSSRHGARGQVAVQASARRPSPSTLQNHRRRVSLGSKPKNVVKL